MMTKKVLIAISLICLSFLLIGCNNNDEIIIPTRGRWVEHIYVSEYLGVEFEMPDSWNSRSGFGLDSGGTLDVEEPALWLFRDGAGFRDMMAGDRELNIASRVMIFFRELYEEYGELSESDILENWLFMSPSFRNVELLEVESERALLGGYEWYSIDGIRNREGDDPREFEIRRLVNIHGGYLRSIFITTPTELLPDEDFELLTLDEIFNHFRDLPISELYDSTYFDDTDRRIVRGTHPVPSHWEEW